MQIKLSHNIFIPLSFPATECERSNKDNESVSQSVSQIHIISTGY